MKDPTGKHINGVLERVQEMVRVDTIEQGAAFKKRSGTFAYIRISDSSARYYKLPEWQVYGVAYNGNITGVDRGTLVKRATLKDFVQNASDEQGWNNAFGLGDTLAARLALKYGSRNVNDAIPVHELLKELEDASNGQTPIVLSQQEASEIRKLLETGQQWSPGTLANPKFRALDNAFKAAIGKLGGN